MALIDPIPSPVLHADFAALEWGPLVELVAAYAASFDVPRPKSRFPCGNDR
jgi:hypothetical protein